MPGNYLTTIKNPVQLLMCWVFYYGIILKNFGEIDVIYKPLSIQNQISKVLSDLDGKIELNNKINDNLSKRINSINLVL